jgi:CspA family cold shock protein
VTTAVFVDQGERMTVGIVKWFNPTKGYGIIQLHSNDGMEDILVLLAEVERVGLQRLIPSQAIMFDVVADPVRGKSVAVNLQLV